MELRTVIAGRLKQEMHRKGFTSDRLARAAQLAPPIVEGYLSGNRELQFELRPLCGVDAAVVGELCEFSTSISVDGRA